jgi:hypothetical protein
MIIKNSSDNTNQAMLKEDIQEIKHSFDKSVPMSKLTATCVCSITDAGNPLNIVKMLLLSLHLLSQLE